MELCPAIKFCTLETGDAPQKYAVSFYLRTIIGVSDEKPIYREADEPTIVEVDLCNYPFGRIKTKCITTPPFHPNWYDSGIWGETGSPDVSEILTELVVRIAKSIQFAPSVTSPYTWSNPVAANWWNQNKSKGWFPCDFTIFPSTEKIRPEPKISIQRNSKT